MESSLASYVTRNPLLASEYLTTQVLVSAGSRIGKSAAAPALLKAPGATAGEMSANKGWRPFTARERKV